jgi:hypothetical protein
MAAIGLDTTTISLIIATVSLIATATFAFFQLRVTMQERDVDFLLQIQSTITSPEYRKAWAQIRDCPHSNYEECLKNEYSYELILGFFDSAGVLLRRRITRAGPFFELFGKSIIRAWDRSRAYVEGAQKQMNDPELYGGFLFLVDKMTKKTKRQENPKRRFNIRFLKH